MIGESIKAHRHFLPGQKPSKYESDRPCTHAGCRTVLSKYNKGPLCYFHTPAKKPRVRGRLPSEEMEKESLHVTCLQCQKMAPPDSLPVLLNHVMHIRGDDGKATACEV